MLMLNNKLCLTSVVEFLRRGRVDRGTGGGKVVVVVDSSKRKVQICPQIVFCVSPSKILYTYLLKNGEV